MAKLKLHAHYASHLPVLLKVVGLTTGPVLELGSGIYSTPVLQALCSPQKRVLVSYENDPEYFKFFGIESFKDDYCQTLLIEDWDKIDIETPWDVAFIDHGPPERRAIETRRLANYAKYLVIHDSDWRNEKHYHYQDIYPLFKWRWDYTAIKPRTTVLSNFVDLTGFSV